MMNYMTAGLVPTGADAASIQDWLTQTGYGTAAGIPSVGANPSPGSVYQAAPGMKVGPDPTMPVYPPGQVIDPKTGQPLAHPAGPNYDLGGWDGVSDKMRYFAQNARYNRISDAALKSQPGVSTSGVGGGGGGFGHLLHTIFGHNRGPGA